MAYYKHYYNYSQVYSTRQEIFTINIGKEMDMNIYLF